MEMLFDIFFFEKFISLIIVIRSSILFLIAYFFELIVRFF